MPAPGPYNSKNLPPIPQTNPPYGGSDHSRTYFWNSSLPSSDIVCSVDYKNVTDSCCPFSFGIRDDYTTGCRMHNDTQFTQWFEKCTHQIWGEVTGRPQDAEPNCVSWDEKMQFTRDREMESTSAPKSGKGELECTTLGSYPGINFTQQCCGQVGGQLANGKDDRGNELCTVKNEMEGKWNECMSALHTYPLCHGEDGGGGMSGSGGEGSGAGPIGAAGSLVFVAAALAVLV
ncbi:hypothetical protein A1Q2_00186 [Trichosporon asahii var. asahii CBS 8904]|uniref:Uncharacterized protein n=1 Tax=Trichosporon asahii var. asahii (strain CBS 8904) TaxID=1220162 RepID=K1VMK6_TRIAC|nr:hypothetical protein A1Q2_00186 [Trichosporon asahii var. asahii CBS 8904]